MTASTTAERVRVDKTYDQLDAELRESEERFRAFVTANSDAVYRMSPDWTEMRHLVGRTFLLDTVEPSLGWLDRYIHHEDQPAIRAAIDRAIETKSMFELEHRVIRADGSLGWTFSRAVPVLAADGEIKEWFGAARDITPRKLAEAALRESEERQAFLLHLTDALRPLTEPGEIERQATRLLGEHLKADRCFLSPVYEDGLGMCVREEYLRAGASSVLGDYTFAQFGEFVGPELHAGRILAIENVDALTGLDAAERASYAATEIGAYLLIPLVRNGRLAAFLTINHRTPRTWSYADKAVARQTADRLWMARERALAETALRESETRYRTLFETMEEGYGLCEAIRDSAGQVIDWRYLELNPALERHSGMDVQAVVGRLFSELFPDTDRSYWLGIYQTVMDTQSSRSFEHYWAPIDRWIAGEASPAGGERFYVIYRDVTERKRAELALRESEERQAFLLKLSDALRPLSDPVEIQDIAARILGEHLDVDRTYYAVVQGDYEYAVVEREYVRGDAPSVIGTHAFATFGSAFDAFRNGRTMVVDDIEAADAIRSEDLAGFRALSIRSLINTPLVKNGRSVAGVTVLKMTPHKWTAQQVSLVEEVAERTWAAVERAHAEAALRASEEERRSLIAKMNEGFCILEVILDDAGHGVDYRFLETNPAFVKQGGFDPAGRLMSAIAPIEPIWPAAYGRVATTGVPERIIDAAASFGRIYDVYAFRIGAASERKIAVFFSDITARREAEERLRENEGRLQVLVAELQHRTRNLMGVVRSMCDATLRASTDLEEFEARFRDRLAALARVQGLLSRLAETDRISFDELLRTELVAQGGLGHEARRVTLKGPARVSLRSSTVQTLAMALHELATNAVKYGALGQPQGRLAVCWSLGHADKDGRPRLIIDWRESGVRMPPPGSTPPGSGHGRELIEQALPYQLGAETSFVLGSDGVHCTISILASASTRVDEIVS